MQEAEQTLGLPPRPASSKNLQPVLLTNRSRPPVATTPCQNLFDANRQKREEISQFLDQNGAGNMSTISTGGGIASNNVSTLNLRNVHQYSETFNRTDMRIYK